MLRKLITAIAVIAIAIMPTLATAQNGSNAELRSAFDQLLRQQSPTWWTVKYDPWSVGSPVVLESTSDGRSAVFAAGFRYTSGREDVIYVAVSDGARTCLSYRSEYGPCTLSRVRSWQQNRQSSRQQGGSSVSGGDILIGAIILCAIFCSGNNEPSRRGEDYDQYEQDCLARGKQPGNC